MTVRPIRPARDDEHARRRMYEDSFDKHGGDRREVIRSAAMALALRDAEIGKLLRVIEDLNPRRNRYT